jgi:hypothetical protein
MVPCVYFPMFRLDKRNKIEYSRPSKIKIKGIKEMKSFMRVHPINAPFGVFGMNTVINSRSKAIIITEGEYDACAVH